MTYAHNGRQFVVMGVRGTATSGAQLVAFALPQPQPPGGRGGRGQRAQALVRNKKDVAQFEDGGSGRLYWIGQPG